MRIKFTSSIGNIEFTRPFKYVDYTGTEMVAEMRTVPLQNQGSLLTGVRLPERVVAINLVLEGIGENDLRDTVRYLFSKCNPLYPGYLEFIFTDETYRLYATPEKVYINKELGSGRRYNKATVTFRAVDPLFYSDEITVNFVEYAAGLRFPFRFPINFGKNGSKNYIVNDGEWSTPVYIKLSGDLEYPVVYNRTTNQELRINAILTGTDFLEISTRLGDEYVKLNGVNAMQYWGEASEFWNLIPGENFVQYRSIGDTNSFSAFMTYRKGYLGL